jgi:hypothetical protein
MITLDLDDADLHDADLPDAVEVQDDGRVVVLMGGAVHASWSAFCEDYDVDPADLLETVMSQIDPAVRAEVDAKEIDEPDDYLKPCARLSGDNG